MNKKNKHIFNSNTLSSLLPDYLSDDYNAWRDNQYQDNKKLLKRLEEQGQKPHSFLIGCCDSRVNILELFKAKPGDFFVHRNIASLIPKYKEQNSLCSVQAALEYAVCSLEVKNILIVGHIGCGGVKAYFDTFNKKKELIDIKYKGLSNWLNIMEPLGEEVKAQIEKYNYQILEKKTVLLSLKNLISYPFVADSIKKKKLIICGLWHNFKTGELEIYNDKTKNFEQV